MSERTHYEAGETSMTDYQFKAYQKALFEFVKAKVDAGASSEEILEAIAALVKPD